MRKNLYKTRKKMWSSKAHYSTSWNLYPEILRILNIKNDEKVLDVGCGYGELSKWIKNVKLYGVDFNRTWVNEAKRKEYEKVVFGDIENLKFENKKFDKSLSIQVFQYLENPKKAFNELIRVTKDQIIISIPNFNWIKLKSLFNKKWKEQYEFCIKNENATNSKFLKNLARDGNIKVKIYYLSNKLRIIRNLFGEIFSSEVVGIYNIR